MLYDNTKPVSACTPCHHIAVLTGPLTVVRFTLYNRVPVAVFTPLNNPAVVNTPDGCRSLIRPWLLHSPR